MVELYLNCIRLLLNTPLRIQRSFILRAEDNRIKLYHKTVTQQVLTEETT